MTDDALVFSIRALNDLVRSRKARKNKELYDKLIAVLSELGAEASGRNLPGVWTTTINDPFGPGEYHIPTVSIVHPYD